MLTAREIAIYALGKTEGVNSLAETLGKGMDDEKKIEIIETLWRIIYSNKDADIYETNLMRRLAGLMYIDNKIMGSIQEKIKKEIS